MAEDDIKSLQSTSVPVSRSKKNGSGKRICLYVASTVACLPCLTWSIFWRAALCPCTCGSSCGGSVLTEDSDNCIEVCYTDIEEEKKTSAFAEGLGIRNNPEFRKRFWDLLVKNSFFDNMKFDRSKTTSDFERAYKKSDWLEEQLKAMGFPDCTLVPSKAQAVTERLLVG